MKTFFAIILTGAVSVIGFSAFAEETVGEKASDAWDTTKQKTKEAAHDIAKTTKDATHSAAKATKKAAKNVKDAVTPDADANKVKVSVTEDSIDMPKSVESGKTAFVVKNFGKEKHNFEVRGHGIDKKFLLALEPDETKVLHVDLKAGNYKAMCLMTEHENKKIEVNLSVR